MQVFISASPHDIKTARRIYNDLKAKDLAPWLPSENLLPGQNRKNEIRKAIRNSRYFLAMLSPHSVAEIGDVQRQMKIAMDLQNEFPEDEIFVIPVRVDDCEPADAMLQEKEFVDLFPSYEDGFSKLLQVFGVTTSENASDKPDSALDALIDDMQSEETATVPPSPPNARKTNDPPVRPESILVILLGAHEWPHWRDLGASEAFSASAEDVKNYFTDPSGFGLPEKNLLNLFDWDEPNQIDLEMASFLENRIAESRQDGTPVTDVMIYYTGHGGFMPGNETYFLAVRATRADNLYVSAIPITSLAGTLKNKARHLRRYIILDCCFAASAFRFFQSGGLSEAVRRQTLEALPKKGTALLCSSSSKTPSEIREGERHTMFSGALLDVLKNGDSAGGISLSLSDVGDRVRAQLLEKYQDEAVKPEVHSPDMSVGDVARTPLFPNPAMMREEPEAGVSESDLPEIDESQFIRDIFELFHIRQAVVLLAQAGREQSTMNQALLAQAGEMFGKENVLPLVPLNGEKTTLADYFADLGNQVNAPEDRVGEITDATGFMKAVESRFSTGGRLFLLVSRFEQGNEAGGRELAGILRNLMERHPDELRLLICGGEQLAEISFVGALSLLNSAEVREWPDFCRNDVVRMCSGLDTDGQTARAMLDLTGGHPRLLEEVVRLCRQGARLDLDECREKLLCSRDIWRAFMPFVQDADMRGDLRALLEKESVASYQPYIFNALVRRLYWQNLLKRTPDGRQLVWRCAVIREIGETMVRDADGNG